jgi:hypothetical protein
MSERGVLYVVAGSQTYADALITSAQSLRHVMPDIPIAVATAREITGPFDHRIPISETDGFRAKILGACQTPFDRTLLLDVDTYVLADLSDVFQLLDRFDMALAHAPVRVSMPLADVPSSFPEFNTGVIAYRRTDVVRIVLEDWLREYDNLSAFDPPSLDQPSFRRVAYRTAELQIATLVPEFNQRFLIAGFFNQPVRVLHGWAAEPGYRKVAEAMTTPAEYRWTAVFTGGRVYDRRGRKIADLIGRRKRLRALAARTRAQLRGMLR